MYEAINRISRHIFFLGDVLEASDELATVANKYNVLIIQGKPLPVESNSCSQEALLQFDQSDCLVEKSTKELKVNGDNAKSSIDVLCDIFTTSNIPDNSGDILQPVSVLNCGMLKICYLIN